MRSIQYLAIGVLLKFFGVAMYFVFLGFLPIMMPIGLGISGALALMSFAGVIICDGIFVYKALNEDWDALFLYYKFNKDKKEVKKNGRKSK